MCEIIIKLIPTSTKCWGFFSMQFSYNRILVVKKFHFTPSIFINVLCTQIIHTSTKTLKPVKIMFFQANNSKEMD